MTSPKPTGQSNRLPADDCVIVFRTDSSGVHGRLARLGAVTQKILAAHALPPAAAQHLGETVVMAALLGSALPTHGNIAVQTKTNGIVSVLYADCEAPGQLRGYARCDHGTLAARAAVGDKPDLAQMIGTGHLAVTIDTGDQAGRYQGVIALDGVPLAHAAADYFEQREALPTFVRLAVAQNYAARAAGGSDVQWRGGGLMIQDPAMPGAAASHLDDSGDDAWQRVKFLAATIEDHELLDPSLTPEHLLLRLFHEEGVVIERVIALASYCKCSREKIANVLATFSDDDIQDMRDDAGNISVTCEFCAKTYDFRANDIARRDAF